MHAAVPAWQLVMAPVTGLILVTIPRTSPVLGRPTASAKSFQVTSPVANGTDASQFLPWPPAEPAGRLIITGLSQPSTWNKVSALTLTSYPSPSSMQKQADAEQPG